MDMAKNEDILINMPHPRTKGSTGFPDAIKDLPFFSDPHYQGVGFRWGMGLDRSEVRMCDYRCQPLFDDMNNWVADKPIPPKYILSISEVRHQQPGDEIYSSSPVTYVKLPAVPTTTDMSPIVQALMRGDSFVTSGEVLMPAYASGHRESAHDLSGPGLDVPAGFRGSDFRRWHQDRSAGHFDDRPAGDEQEALGHPVQCVREKWVRLRVGRAGTAHVGSQPKRGNAAAHSNGGER
jgi:hypothetical protein